MGKSLTIAFAAILILLRILIAAMVDPEPITWAQVYKDIAHLFMGGLFVSWWTHRQKIRKWGVGETVIYREPINLRWFVWWQWQLFWFLNIVEITAAIVSRV